ncbi:MAG: ribosome maturation factor RimM [Acutalibacteraceae bacterium]
MKKQFIETGKIVGTHGIAGEMRLQPWADSPASVAALPELYIDEKGTPLGVHSMRVHGNIVLIKARDVRSIEAAERLRNTVVYAAREDILPAGGRYLVSDIIGCKAYDADDETIVYGEITDVSQTGANDVWHISRNGKEYLVPVIPDVVISADVDSGIVRLRPLKGIFDED